MTRRRVLTTLAGLATLASGCQQVGEGEQGSNRLASRSTAELLSLWNPREGDLWGTEDSSDAYFQLTYRMAAGQVREAQCQQFLDKTYEFDLHGARRQLARTPPSWPLDGHAFVRTCPVYPVSTTEIRWRRAGDPTWRTVSQVGAFAYLDLGPPSPGPQTASIEYQLINGDKTLWRGSLDVHYEGRGNLADGATLVTDESVGSWLRAEVRPSLDVSRRKGLAFLTVYPPPAKHNPSGVHMAFKVELLRDGAIVGDTYVVFGRGLDGMLCSPLPPLSVEWREPGTASARAGGEWTARLTSAPELAAASEFDDFQASDPPPRTVWCGTVEVPVQVVDLAR